MKKTLITLVLLMFLSTPLAFGDDIFENTDLGAKVDAPNLIAFGSSGNHHVGAEISIFDITENWDEGSQAYVKYTYSGTIFGGNK